MATEGWHKVRDDLVALTLAGGGARGAYEAGALAAVAELAPTDALPFQILTGSSSGALNATFLASRADDFRAAARALGDQWTTIAPHRVFRTDARTLARTAIGWTATLGLGGTIGAGHARALLDTSPLRELIRSHFDPDAIARHVSGGQLHGVAVTATSYEGGRAVTFFEGSERIAPWSRFMRAGVRVRLDARHVLASASIPLFFPAVEIGGRWYTDGSLRLSTPLSPAIHLGARRILAIAVRHATSGPLLRLPPEIDGRSSVELQPSIADTAGLVLNAVFLESLGPDVERASRINQTMHLLSESLPSTDATPLRVVDILLLRPSVDPASLVLSTLARLPGALRHMFRGLGASEKAGWELLSYLGFDSAYTTRLFQLGYDDTLARSEEVKAFLGARPVEDNLRQARPSV